MYARNRKAQFPGFIDPEYEFWFSGRFRDQSLNINEFTALLKALFRNEKGKPYPVDGYMANELFMIFNTSGVNSTQNYFSLI